MAALLRNLRYSVRALCKSPGLTLTILSTLALGIRANTAIFTVDYATLLAEVPFANPKQLVMLCANIQGLQNRISAGDFIDWQRQNSSFQKLIAFTDSLLHIATKDQPENILGVKRLAPATSTCWASPFCTGGTFSPRKPWKAKATS